MHSSPFLTLFPNPCYYRDRRQQNPSHQRPFIFTAATAITWTGTVSHSTDLRITFAVTVTAADTQAIINQAQASDGQQVVTASVTTIVNGLDMYLPQIQRH